MGLRVKSSWLSLSGLTHWPTGFVLQGLVQRNTLYKNIQSAHLITDSSLAFFLIKQESFSLLLMRCLTTSIFHLSAKFSGSYRVGLYILCGSLPYSDDLRWKAGLMIFCWVSIFLSFHFNYYILFLVRVPYYAYLLTLFLTANLGHPLRTWLMNMLLECQMAVEEDYNLEIRHHVMG